MSATIMERVTGVEPVAIRPPLPLLTLTALIGTVLLILVGSIVRVTGYGLGCPDWPLCYGQVVPPLKLGAWVEYSHRLVAGIVSVQVVALALLAWRHHRRAPRIVRPALTALGVLAVQVILGGLHVLNELPSWTGVIHTAVAMLVLGLLAGLAAETRPEWRELRLRAGQRLAGTRLPLWTAVGAGATYVLLLTGSLVTRTGASLACPAFPHCGLEAVPDTLQYLVTVQMIHRLAAFAVAGAIGLIVVELLQAGRGDAGLQKLALALGGLVLLQFGLGVSNVLLRLPMWSRSLHLAVGATIWALLVLAAVTFYRSCQPPAISHQQPV